jgi:hypothetical protein
MFTRRRLSTRQNFRFLNRAARPPAIPVRTAHGRVGEAGQIESDFALDFKNEIGAS